MNFEGSENSERILRILRILNRQAEMIICLAIFVYYALNQYVTRILSTILRILGEFWGNSEEF